jgi:hypothetical protein
MIQDAEKELGSAIFNDDDLRLIFSLLKETTGIQDIYRNSSVPGNTPSP